MKSSSQTPLTPHSSHFNVCLDVVLEVFAWHVSIALVSNASKPTLLTHPWRTARTTRLGAMIFPPVPIHFVGFESKPNLHTRQLVLLPMSVPRPDHLCCPCRLRQSLTFWTPSLPTRAGVPVLLRSDSWCTTLPRRTNARRTVALWNRNRTTIVWHNPML